MHSLAAPVPTTLLVPKELDAGVPGAPVEPAPLAPASRQSGGVKRSDNISARESPSGPIIEPRSGESASVRKPGAQLFDGDDPQL